MLRQGSAIVAEELPHAGVTVRSDRFILLSMCSFFDTLRQECQRFLDPPAGATRHLATTCRSPAVPRR